MKQNEKKRNNHAGSTQKFIEVRDIVDDAVFLTNGTACLVVEVQATNFSLLSGDEQMTKITSYASLLNSLSFSIQILIRNKPVDISSYLDHLEEQKTMVKNDKLRDQITLYKDFITEIVKVNTVLDKKFYIVIPYSPLEKGATEAFRKNGREETVLTTLHGKSETLLSQFARLGLGAKVLDKEGLIKLFYEIYNGNINQATSITDTYTPPVVQKTPA